jgi:hypothetical protein
MLVAAKRTQSAHCSLLLLLLLLPPLLLLQVD